MKPEGLRQGVGRRSEKQGSEGVSISWEKQGSRHVKRPAHTNPETVPTATHKKHNCTGSAATRDSQEPIYTEGPGRSKPGVWEPRVIACSR